MMDGRAAKGPMVLLGAIAINVLLFSAIEFMVGNRQLRLTETTDVDIANFIRVAEQNREVRSRRDPEAPQKPRNEVEKDLNRLSEAASAGTMSGLTVDIPELNIDVEIGGTVQVARQLTPLVRIPPEYPVLALQNEIEGYVILRFTVTETGSVADPEVLRSDPPRIFDRAARRAILRWKYQPQIVDGKPTSVVSYTKINFELLEGQQ